MTTVTTLTRPALGDLHDAVRVAVSLAAVLLRVEHLVRRMAVPGLQDIDYGSL